MIARNEAYDLEALATAITESVSQSHGARQLPGGEWRFSCPNPHHEDREPSASWNEVEGVWCCHARQCHETVMGGGGTLSLARLLGLNVDEYRRPADSSAFAANGRPGSSRPSDAREHVYADATGSPVLRVTVRRAEGGGKKVAQFIPDGAGGWKPGGGRWSNDRPLYRLPEILAAPDDVIVFVVEGERDAETLAAHGRLATTSAMGAGKAGATDWRPLTGRDVVVLPDHDRPGWDHAQDVAQRVTEAGARSVKIVPLPGEPVGDDLPPNHGRDVSDWLGGGGDVASLVEAIASALPWEPEASSGPDDAGEDEPQARRSIASQIVELVIGTGAELFHDAEKAGYMSLARDGHRETWRLSGSQCQLLIKGMYYTATGRVPSAAALSEALGVLECRAQFDGPQHQVFVRVAEADGALYLDLGTPDWVVVEVTSQGWRLIADPPVRFVRPATMQPLPRPVRGGSINLLRRYVRVADENWPLIVGWLLAGLRPRGPYPVLILGGEQGSTKSTATRVLRGVIDPRRPATLTEPRNEQDLVIAACNGHVLAFDNLSRVSPTMSDALCRLSTGGGYATRTLYTDRDETVFEGARPIILNGIGELTARPDLLDRALLVTLARVPDAERRPENELWAEFYADLPAILGALLDAAVEALRNYPDVKLEDLPRMADFAKWAVAGEQALGLAPGSFIAAYQENRAEAREQALEASPVGPALVALIERLGFWEGSAGELLAVLDDPLLLGSAYMPSGWPRSPQGMGRTLDRLAPNLREAGIQVERFRELGGKRRRGMYRLKLVEEDDPNSPNSPNSPGPRDSGVDDGPIRDRSGALTGSSHQQEAEVARPEIPPSSLARGHFGLNGLFPGLPSHEVAQRPEYLSGSSVPGRPPPLLSVGTPPAWLDEMPDADDDYAAAIANEVDDDPTVARNLLAAARELDDDVMASVHFEWEPR